MSYEIEKISSLPSKSDIRKKAQGLALLDAVLMPEWQYRYFSFNCHWDKNKMMASMRDGAGNEYFIQFSEYGVVGKVFYEKELEEANLFLNDIPDCFADFKNEPAFSIKRASFYFWQGKNDEMWFASPNDLNTYPLLGFLSNDCSYYHRWAEDYYETSIDVSFLKNAFDSLYIDVKDSNVLNNKLSVDILKSDIDEITGFNIDDIM